MTNQDELDHFVAVLDDQTGCGFTKVERWYAAFSLLDKQIDDSKKTVVLLDEISWMGHCDHTFPGVLRTAWETLFHRHDKLIVVVCGSVSSWIKKNILGDTGFTGRFSRDYIIPELSLAECAEFWGEAKDRVGVREMLDVLSVTGGVPRYLEEVDPGLSAEENIRRMCFVKGGELYKDFDAIFDPVLGESMVVKKKLLEALSEGPMSGAELAAKLGIGRNGRLSEMLKDLELGGFISSDPGLNPETGKAMRISKFRLRDNYTRFYLKYVMPHKSEIETGTYRHASLEHLPEWNAVMGLQFENLVINNAMDVAACIGMGNATIVSAAPYSNSQKGRNGKAAGCQIDLLVQTPKTAYVVEVKRKNFIDSGIEEEVRQKMKRLPIRAGMTVRPVLVYAGELSKSVEADGYFDALVPARRLFGM